MTKIWVTGDLITPDGSDTSVYGDPCEPGEGMSMESGWVQTGWSRWDVYESRDDVEPFTWEADDGPVVEWIIEKIHETCGWVETDGSDGRTYYGQEADTHAYDGRSMSYAVHIDDASPAILSAVRYGLTFRQSRAGMAAIG